MSLLDKLKSLLGLGGSRRTSTDEREVGVTVERDRERRTDAGTERAVKESPPETTEPTEPETTGPTEERTEPEPQDSEESAAEGEPDEEPDPEAGTEVEDRVPSEAVDVIKGIGPTYADRLSTAGVETVADLAEADAADLSDRADVPEGRVENWIEQANARSR